MASAEKIETVFASARAADFAVAIENRESISFLQYAGAVVLTRGDDRDMLMWFELDRLIHDASLVLKGIRPAKRPPL
jgi:hypothetical protein